MTGCVEVWYPLGTSFVNLISGEVMANTNSPILAESPGGDGVKFTAGSSTIAKATNALINGYPNVAIGAFFTPTAFPGNSRYFAFGNSASNSPLLDINDQTSGAVAISARNDAATTLLQPTSPNSTMKVGVPVVVSGDAVFATSGTAKLYVNGRYLGSNSGDINVPVTFNRTALGGLSRTSDGLFTSAIIHVAVAWNRNLSPDEHLLFGQDPCGFLIYPEDDIFAEFVGIGAAPTFNPAWAMNKMSVLGGGYPNV